MLLIKKQKLKFNQINIFIETYQKNLYKQLFLYFFYSLDLRLKFIKSIKNKKYFVYFLKKNPLSSIYKFYKKKTKKFTVIRAPFTFKKSKEQFEQKIYKFLIKSTIIDLFYFIDVTNLKQIQKYNLKYNIQVKTRGTIIF